MTDLLKSEMKRKEENKTYERRVVNDKTSHVFFSWGNYNHYIVL